MDTLTLQLLNSYYSQDTDDIPGRPLRSTFVMDTLHVIIIIMLDMTIFPINFAVRLSLMYIHVLTILGLRFCASNFTLQLSNYDNHP